MIDLAALLAHAADLWSVTVDDLRQAKRGNGRIIAARQALALVLAESEYTTVEIGQMLSKDHSTICNSLKQARRKLDDDPTFVARYRALADAATPAPRTVAETVTRRRDAWTIDTSVHIALFFWGVPNVVSA